MKGDSPMVLRCAMYMKLRLCTECRLPNFVKRQCQQPAMAQENMLRCFRAMAFAERGELRCYVPHLRR